MHILFLTFIIIVVVVVAAAAADGGGGYDDDHDGDNHNGLCHLECLQQKFILSSYDFT